MNVIQQIIDLTGFSYSKIARETGVNRLKVSDYLNNKRELSTKDRELLIKYLSSLKPLKTTNRKEGLIEENKNINITIGTERKKRSSKYTEEEIKERKKLFNDRAWLTCEKKHFGCVVTRRNQKIALDNEIKCPICNSKLVLKTRRKNDKDN